MNNNLQGCAVAPITKCNHATSTHDNATHNETTTQPLGLLSIAIKVLERNKSNSIRNLSATSQLHYRNTNATETLEALSSNTGLHRRATILGVAAIGENHDSCIVSFPTGHNHKTHFTCHQCGYRNPFCSCKLPPKSGMVTCNSCNYFTVDIIGDGAGIGSCELGIKWTQEFNGRMPLFRYSERYCEQFNKLMD
ncbi:TPA: hypothetical protein F8A23_08735 [Legionella pneumophila]|uniref:Uncharacterized protein n=1 Tax=Legionella pneumophila TaxID=446 RepID=A0AAP3HFI6_LEGPN|nr:MULTISPECIES: hypothetical protein [Legionella]BCL64457.1 hypothetical protein [Legionella pneumophila serogroup 7]AOW57833.1 hypothetical protein BE843_05940 [Legionella pneumophila subsp. pneumophila]AOW61983.1 hypothetical protein BE844_12830 [Legionella pneumophila subsp. pneumophila]MCW8395575.1 hypothetical protein [Legionella sp. PATHC039]MCZ4690929.1 hypothetical protein [Legionella pneumophila]